MSCVRASESGNVGFLSDVRRMNVALTRARTSLWILGNKKSLLRNTVWKRLLDDAAERNAVSEAHPGFLKKIFKLPPQATPDTKKIENKREPENDEGHTFKRSKTQLSEARVSKTSEDSNHNDYSKENSFQGFRDQPPNGSTERHNTTQYNETKIYDKDRKGVSKHNGSSNYSKQHIPSSSGTIPRPNFTKKTSSIFINKKRPSSHR